MIEKTKQKFRSLPRAVRAMVFLFWVYQFVQTISVIFLNLFVFVVTESVTTLLIYNAILWSGTFVGFSVWGYVVAQQQWSMRLNYFKSFVLYIISFLFLAFFHDTAMHLYVFAALNGVALGMFWLGVHTFEMLLTKEENRDFYSSVVSAGNQVLIVLAPLIATITFFFSERVLNTEPYTILFWILPFVYALSFPFLFSLPNFVPPKFSLSHLWSLMREKKYRKVRLYQLFGSTRPVYQGVIIPIAALAALGSVVNIGVFETVIGILSAVFVIYLSHHRHQNNRMRVLWYVTIGVALSLILLFFHDLSVWFYVGYGVVAAFAVPLMRVSKHVIDLHSVEKMRSTTSFYEGLLFRELVLGCGRIALIGIISCIAFFVADKTLFVQIAVSLWTCNIFFTAFLAQRFIENKAS